MSKPTNAPLKLAQAAKVKNWVESHKAEIKRHDYAVFQEAYKRLRTADSESFNTLWKRFNAVFLLDSGEVDFTVESVIDAYYS